MSLAEPASVHEHCVPDRDALRLEGATVRVDGVALIQAANLSLSRPSVTGLIGPNGAGKSTLLRVLARQQALSAGALFLDGRPHTALGSRAFARQVAYLPQSLPATPGMTVHELVCLGRFPWHGALGRFSAHDRAAVEGALAITHTGHLADRFTESLSGGELQRCWIAMMLAQEAGVLLLDEPVSALDARHQTETMALVHRLAQSRSVAIVVVLHDVNLAARYCHRIVALKAGHVAWEGAASQLMDAGVLEHIYDTRMTVLPTPDLGGSFAFATPPEV